MKMKQIALGVLVSAAIVGGIYVAGIIAWWLTGNWSVGQ